MDYTFTEIAISVAWILGVVFYWSLIYLYYQNKPWWLIILLSFVSIVLGWLGFIFLLVFGIEYLLDLRIKNKLK